MKADIIQPLLSYRVRWWLLFGVALSPFCWLVWSVIQNTLGPDPAEALMHTTGEWALRFLVVVLMARPFSQWGWPVLFRARRMFGLFVAFYASLHLLVFAQVYVGWSGAILAEELAERPYVVAGFGAWLLLLPLSVTSLHSVRRRMGRYWRSLHRAVYLIALLATLHVLWLSRSDVGDALLYALVFGALLAWRVAVFWRKSLRAKQSS
jgi:sulfoxide reductase heme-binding subunit YedZ